MREQKSAMAGGWVSICGERDAAVESLLAARTEEACRTRLYRAEDRDYLKKMNMHVAPGSLAVSDAILEKLRKMCQLWYVDIRPSREISSHRPLIGPVIVALKRALFPLVRFCLKDSMKQQRDFNAAVIAAITQIAAGDQNQRGEQ